jgi:hypothetical protein
METSDLAKAIRIGVGAVGVVGVGGGALLLASGGVAAAAGLWLFIIGAVLVTAAVFEQVRYRARRELASGERAAAESRAAAALRRTDEVFEDPTSGVLLRVWFDPATGEREYRPEP